MRNRGFDIIRGIAISLVLLRHSWPGVFGGAGVVGVGLFFVLSGYLITGLLASEYAMTGSINFKRFYWNRSVRLLPALLGLLVVVVIVHSVANPLKDNENLLSSLLIGLSYTADFHLPGLTTALGHLWTLSIEEQFYFLWPALLFLFFKKGWTQNGLLTLAASFIAASALVQSILAPNWAAMYTLPTSWGLCLLVGCVAKLGVHERTQKIVAHPGFAYSALIYMAVLSVVPEAKATAWLYPVGIPALAIASISLILRAEQDGGSGPLRAIISRLGLISYAAYLWNVPLQKWLPTFLGLNNSLWSGTALVAITVLCGYLSGALLETPLKRLRW